MAETTDTTDVDLDASQASPVSGPLLGLIGPASDFLGGTFRLGGAATHQGANVLAGAAGPAVVLLVGGLLLAWFVRKR